MYSNCIIFGSADFVIVEYTIVLKAGVDFFFPILFYQIYIWNFKDNNDLVGMAFIDTQMYIHTLVSIKNLIIAADLCKSITLLRLQVITIKFFSFSFSSLFTAKLQYP